LQASATSQAPFAARHTVPELPAGCWHAVAVPLHWSRVQGFPSLGQLVPAEAFASVGQLGDPPEHASVTSQSSTAERQTVLPEANPSTGQVVETPLHVSATSQTPPLARHVTPAPPAGCWQAVLEPSHWSLVHGFESLVHAVPLAFFASEGQLGPLPGHISAASHSATAARHVVLAEAKASVGQVVELPVQASAVSQAPFAARHTAPELPAGCWQEVLEPLHVSVLHGLPSSVHAVPGDLRPSAGQLAELPVQASA
jgi:hypothetical protein